MTHDFTIGTLRDLFFVNEAGWTVYRRKGGSIGCQSMSKSGQHNVAQAVKAGGKVLVNVTGFSRREALSAAKRSGR